MCDVRRTASWEEDSLCSLHIQFWNNQLLEIKHTVLKCSILTTALAENSWAVISGQLGANLFYYGAICFQQPVFVCF